VTPRERALRLRLKNDFIHYAEKCLKIRAKDGGIAPLRLNAAQRHIHAALEKQLAGTGRVRALILKGRQQGCSTYVEARFYWKVTHGRGLSAFILTHLDEATRNIYQMVQRFHDHCPRPVRPHTSAVNARELRFDKLDSGYMVGTAKSQGVGRSATVQYFHGSEVAFWANAQEHVSGILQAVPDAAGTEVILESTASAEGGLFRKLCEKAMSGAGDYAFIFVPWFLQEEYRKTPPEGFAPTPEEQDVAARFGLDAAQICWRREKIAALDGIFAFRREYPASPEEAFLADNPHALWTRETIAKNRRGREGLPQMKRVVVAIDPAVSAKASSDETGIVVAGLGADDHVYILDDLSGRYTPAEWASKAVRAYETHGADRVVAEINQGGDLVEHTLRACDANVAYRGVRAARGKVTRAEPVAALDERGLVHHAGFFPALEDQMCAFDPASGGASPDRADARVWAVTELALGRQPGAGPRVW
jgi:predicted phage terminase large subunit-like protein